MKRVLLAVCGLSPQVITETLFALHQQGRMANAVRVLTTREGKDRCLSQLFGAGDGAFLQFLDEYGIARETVEFSPHHVRAISGQDGIERDDIVNEDDNELFLRTCMEAAFDLTQSPDSAVYFSLSGGRKTMSACLATAAQFYARAQDRLFHVLVSPEFESSREFFFPRNPPRETLLYDAVGKPFRKSCEHAQVTLVPMPFVSIRERISTAHLQRPEAPADLLASLVREPRPELTIDLHQGKVCWKKLECDIPASYLALYAFFAVVKKEAACEQAECAGCHACFLTYGEISEQKGRIADLYRRIVPQKDFAAMSKTGILNLDEENLRSNKKKLHDALERGLGTIDLPLLDIVAHGRPKRFGIALGKERIRIVL